ncbi:MAG: hypothetical protein IKH10_02530, partial [Bacteroidetes bacterium]|nr:hypothetical protein [Bacteroidota bacterium]
AVGTDKLASNAVTSAKIADGNVTTAKLANNAVTPDKLSGTFTADKFVKVNANGSAFETAEIGKAQIKGGSAIAENYMIMAGSTSDNNIKQSNIYQNSSAVVVDDSLNVKENLGVDGSVTVGGNLTLNGETIMNTTSTSSDSISVSGKTVIVITGATVNRRLANGTNGQVIYLISGQNTSYTIKNSNGQNTIGTIQANKTATFIYVGTTNDGTWHQL